jgi:small GTP-binding protein
MLDSKTLAITHEVRSLVAGSLELLARGGIDTAPLKQALLDLDGPFLLVVAGEFNSGKSSLLNALLDADLLKEGVTPTTDRVNLIGYGEEAKLYTESAELALVYLPHPLLKDVHLVDTPGTNAIEQHHQVLTERFLPRADLILFVTSSDRPFTQSEAKFLAFIRDWGKKIVLVINKMDLLSGPELEQVLEFVRGGLEQTLGNIPPIFAVSARRARKGEQDSYIPQLQEHIRQVLSKEAAALKLGSPLGIAIRLIDEAKPILQAKQSETQLQLGNIRDLDALAERHALRTRQDFQQQIALVLQSLDSVQARGEAWLEETVRISNFVNLLNSSKFKQSFIDQVVKGANTDIEKGVLQATNWLARRESELFEDALHLLREAPALKQGKTSEAVTVEHQLEAALKSFQPEEEARLLKNAVQESLQRTALVEFTAVGVGAGMLLLFNRILLDVLGIFTGLIIAVIGFTILPRRREQAKTQLKERLLELREKIRLALEQNLDLELSRTKERFQSLYRASALRLESALQATEQQLTLQESLKNQALELKRKL